jgi:hypothetical protein
MLRRLIAMTAIIVLVAALLLLMRRVYLHHEATVTDDDTPTSVVGSLLPAQPGVPFPGLERWTVHGRV